MSEQEQAALEELQKESAAIRKRAFVGMANCLRMSDNELSHTGHKTREAALVAHFKYAKEQIDALVKKHIKAFPDAK